MPVAIFTTVDNHAGLCSAKIRQRNDIDLVRYNTYSAKQLGFMSFELSIIDNTKTKAMSPQTNGICERFDKTILDEFYQVTFRKKLYSNMEDLQKYLDVLMEYYNNDRTHQSKMCCGRTPLGTLLDGKSIWAEKNLAQI